MKKAFKFFWLFFLLSGVNAQILDDSTKLLYSLKTVRFRNETQMVMNRGGQQGDSSLNCFSEKGDFLYQNGRMFQNLGVFGTGARLLLYELPTSIGLRNGMTQFDYLIPDHHHIRYFNTLSPYSDIQYAQGARQRAMLKTTFSVNALQGLNLTGHYQRLTAMRNLNVTQSEQRLSDHHSAYVSGNFSDSAGRYRAWGHYQHLNHLQYETGGGLAPTPSLQDSLFISPDLMPVRLDGNARTRELRNKIHFSQLWKPFGSGLYIRTHHTRSRQVNRYTDPNPRLSYYGPGRLYFQKNPVSGTQPDTLFSDRSFQLVENALYGGFQDSLQDLSFYIKRRDVRFFSNFQTYLSRRTEYVYGFAFQGLYKGASARLLAEWLSPDEFDLHAGIVLKGWNLGGRILSFQPSLIQREFTSKNLIYLTDFIPSRALRFTFDKKFQFGKWAISPTFENLSVANGIAFDTSFSPVQRDKLSTMQYLGVSFQGSLGRFFSENRFIRVFQAGSRISQMPAYIYRSTHWVELIRNRKAYGVQLGFNLDWRFDWPSEVYNPLTGQWYLQEQSTIPPYFLLDAFAHIRIDRVRLYFKVHNTLQKLGSLGYFALPDYPAQRRLFEFGLNWTFYD